MLFVIGVACLATWAALRPQLESLIVPGAANVQVVATGWGQRQITYRAPGPPYAWYYAITHSLEAQGWIALDSWPSAVIPSVNNPVIPLQFQRDYDKFIHDHIIIVRDDLSPNLTRITVRRWISLPWRSLRLRLPG